MKQTSKVLSMLLALLMLFFMMSSVSAAGLTVKSATIGGTPIGQVADIHGNDSILLTFSGNVTDSSVWASNVSKIKVTNTSTGNAASATVSITGGKQVTVTLGGVGRADYKLTIGKEFKDTGGNTLGSPYALPFTVNKGNGTGDGGGSNPLSFISAKANGANLSGAVLKGNEIITLQFDRGMKNNETENAAQIAVKKADGTKANYTVLPVDNSQDSTKRLIQVQLGGLDDGDYTLTIGKDLKANNGKTLGEDITISFSVNSAGSSDSGSGSGFSAFWASIVNAFKNFFDLLLNLFK